jgi:hypothetical protein
MKGFGSIVSRRAVHVALQGMAQAAGYTIDLHVRTTVRVFAESWRGIR